MFLLVLLQLQAVELVAGMGADAVLDLVLGALCFVLVESRSSVVQEQLKQN